MKQPREFEDWIDLASNASEEEIVGWVNWLAEMLHSQQRYGKKYRLKSKLIRQAAAKLLDPDELERIEAEAAERLEGETTKWHKPD